MVLTNRRQIVVIQEWRWNTTAKVLSAKSRKPCLNFSHVLTAQCIYQYKVHHAWQFVLKFRLCREIHIFALYYPICKFIPLYSLFHTVFIEVVWKRKCVSIKRNWKVKESIMVLKFVMIELLAVKNVFIGIKQNSVKHHKKYVHSFIFHSDSGSLTCQQRVPHKRIQLSYCWRIDDDMPTCYRVSNNNPQNIVLFVCVMNLCCKTWS